MEKIMFKRVLLLVCLVAVLVVPGMAYDYSESPSVVIYGWANQLAPSTGGVGSGAGGYAFDTLRVRHIESFADVTLLRISGDARAYDIPYDSQSFSVDLLIGSNVIGHGTYGTFRSGSHDVIWVMIDSPLNVGGYSGIQTIKLVKSAGETGTFATGSNIPGIVDSWRDYRKDSNTYKFKWDSSVSWDKPGYEWAFYRSVDTSFEVYGTAPHEVYYDTEWWCSYTFDESLHGMYQFELNRPQGAYVYITDRLNELRYVDDTLRFSDVSIFLDNAPFTVSVSPNLVNWVNQTHYASVAPADSVTIYVRNSQTDALIANAHIDISASVNGNLHEVANETVPSGIYSSDLQPTGGGMPNPDFYRLIVTAEGYNSIMPYIDFEVDGGATIYAYLDPIGGAPEDENNTFIDFFVRDMSANPISGATVNFGGYTLITNSAGYTIFEVDKSKTYSWTVSKSGYGSLTGNAVIGDAPRHTINTVLAPAVTPTIPTAIPTSTSISPTPTMTAPTGEPVSNWLEWFAAHFGMILGGGAEIGKIFMWLCFAVPVGVYVGKEAKAGAAGFLAGAGIVTLFFVLIGWVPIWLLVLLALVIGLLYAKVFNAQDNGGGR